MRLQHQPQWTKVRRILIATFSAGVLGIPLQPQAPLAADAPRIDPKLEPYCQDAKLFEEYLRKNGFTSDDELTFKSGAVLKRYRFMGDMLWMAVTPDGGGCLLPMGMLRQPPLIHP